MKNLIYQVSVGKPSKLYEHCTKSARFYANKIGAYYLIQREPRLKIRPDPFATGRSREATERLGYLPIYEKENAFEYFPEFDNILILDSDIYVRPDSPNIFEQVPDDVEFAGHIERDGPILEHYQAKLRNYTNMQYNHKGINHLFEWEMHNGADFYNMGMMYLNKSIHKYLNGQTPREFIRRDEFKPFVDGVGPWKWSTDQTLLNYWVKKEKMKVHNLDYKWNALFTAIDEASLKDAYFIHFFLKDKLPERGENVQQLMAQI